MAIELGKVRVAYLKARTRTTLPAQLYDAFWADRPSELERFWLYSVLSCASVAELSRIIYLEGLPLRAVDGAQHQVVVLRHDLTNWLNQFTNCPSAS